MASAPGLIARPSEHWKPEQCGGMQHSSFLHPSKEHVSVSGFALGCIISGHGKLVQVGASQHVCLAHPFNQGISVR
jgi:hypothetical protein